MRFEKTILLRVPMELYRDHLEPMDNYSAWIRDAILDKLEKEGNPKIIDAKIQEHNQEIKRLQDLKKQKSQLGNYKDIISDFHQDPGKPQIYDSLSRNVCFNYFKTKYWPRIKNLPEYKSKNPADVFNEIMEEQ